MAGSEEIVLLESGDGEQKMSWTAGYSQPLSHEPRCYVHPAYRSDTGRTALVQQLHSVGTMGATSP